MKEDSDIIITGKCANCGVEYHIHTKRHTGLKDGNGRDVIEGDMYLEEIEHEGGDERSYYVVKWIKEWAMFSILTPEELTEHADTGVEHFDKELRDTYIIEASVFEKMYFKGNVLDSPELLFYENLKY